MNILFIEDEKELARTAVAQLELKGYTVFPAFDIAEARAVLEDAGNPIHFVITDHRLPDGLGIQFVVEMKDSYPKCKCAVVSGCLTDGDIVELQTHHIPYYRKPLLYGKVIDDLRRMHASVAPEHVEPEPEEESELPEEPEDKPKKGFTMWPFKKS